MKKKNKKRWSIKLKEKTTYLIRKKHCYTEYAATATTLSSIFKLISTDPWNYCQRKFSKIAHTSLWERNTPTTPTSTSLPVSFWMNWRERIPPTLSKLIDCFFPPKPVVLKQRERLIHGRNCSSCPTTHPIESLFGHRPIKHAGVSGYVLLRCGAAAAAAGMLYRCTGMGGFKKRCYRKNTRIHRWNAAGGASNTNNQQ